MAEAVVRFADQFFADLDQLLPAERTNSGTPSRVDFLLYELPRFRDRLAQDFHANTMPSDEPGMLRVLVGTGVLVARVALYASAAEDGSVDVVALDLDLRYEDEPDD